MNDTVTADFSRFGWVDLRLAAQLLQVYAEKGADFLGQGITVNLNTNSGYVFLSDEDYAVGMLNEKGNKIVQFYSCSECGYENTQEDAEAEEKDFIRFEGFCSKECWSKNQ